MKNGVKYDQEKPDYSLLPPKSLDLTVQCLTFGASKYDRHNWAKVQDADIRYFAAAMRHLWAHFRGEINDDESGLPHLAHALCCIFFLLELKQNNETK